MLEAGLTDQTGSKIAIAIPGLPLSVYREVAAHLQQVGGVEVGLAPQTSPQFDYGHSQVGALWIQYTDNANPASRQHVDRILAYYGARFGEWTMFS
jgi:hypothetical protein